MGTHSDTWVFQSFLLIIYRLYIVRTFQGRVLYTERLKNWAKR